VSRLNGMSEYLEIASPHCELRRVGLGQTSLDRKGVEHGPGHISQPGREHCGCVGGWC